jgi:hypothetical protein
MRKFAEKNFETIASILIVAAFAGVAMFFNLGNRAFFDGRMLNGTNEVMLAREAPPIYAENVWRGRHTWQPVELDRGGLSLEEFTQRMFRKTFPGQDSGFRIQDSGGSGHRAIGSLKNLAIGSSGHRAIENQSAGARVLASAESAQSADKALHEGTANLPHWVHVVARHADGKIFLDVWGHNLRVNSGINWQYNQMAGTTAAACTYIALSNASITPNATDTSLASEITSNGLARALATPAHTSNATSYTLSNTFTATGTQAAQAAAILNASSSGTMCFENTFTQASLVSGDTLTVTWTISF